ncbi:MAG: outer membrane protein OmpA-like peptidoglycan-associated protein [Methylophagaceae bacterium]|jgi:outer membrane protein OmpA-like peptidoglycan-associated protein
MIKKILLSCFAIMPFYGQAEQFQPALTDTQWSLVNTPIECGLSQPIRDFGSAKFSQISGYPFSLIYQTNTQPTRQGTVTFEIAQAPWQNSEQREDPVIVQTKQGQITFRIEGVNARQALSHLSEGRFPTIFYLSQHSNQEINVLMSTVHLQDYLPQFEACLVTLLPYSFEDIQNLTINFELEKAELGELEKLALMRVVKFVEADPSIRKIALAGHTDNHGRKRLNQALSDARATVVKNFLIDSGVSESLIAISSYLELIPVMSNKTQTGRAHNRRTEIKVFR